MWSPSKNIIFYDDFKSLQNSISKKMKVQGKIWEVEVNRAQMGRHRSIDLELYDYLWIRESEVMEFEKK